MQLANTRLPVCRLPKSTVVLPAGAATLSLVVLLTQVAVNLTPPIRAKLAGYEAPQNDASTAEPTAAARRERRALQKFQVSRLLLCVLLLALSVVTAITGKVEGQAHLLNLSLIGVYVRDIGSQWDGVSRASD